MYVTLWRKNEMLREFSTKRCHLSFTSLNFIKRIVEKYKKRKIPTRVHIAAPRVTSRAEYKPPLGMHVALSFKEVHEVGEWEIMPSTRFLSATGKHTFRLSFSSPLPFFFSLNFHFSLSLPSFICIPRINRRTTGRMHSTI